MRKFGIWVATTGVVLGLCAASVAAPPLEQDAYRRIGSSVFAQSYVYPGDGMASRLVYVLDNFDVNGTYVNSTLDFEEYILNVYTGYSYLFVRCPVPAGTAAVNTGARSASVNTSIDASAPGCTKHWYKCEFGDTMTCGEYPYTGVINLQLRISNPATYSSEVSNGTMVDPSGTTRYVCQSNSFIGMQKGNMIVDGTPLPIVQANAEKKACTNQQK